MKHTESQIKKAILKWLNLQPDTFAFVVVTTGIPDFHRRGGFRKNPNSGISDILGCKRGKFFAFEVKTERGKLTPKQRSFLEAVFVAGGWGYVVRSLEDVQEAFKEIR